MEVQRRKKRGKKRKADQPAAEVCLPAPSLTQRPGGCWEASLLPASPVLSEHKCRYRMKHRQQEPQQHIQSPLQRTQFKVRLQRLRKPPSAGELRMEPQHSQRR